MHSNHKLYLLSLWHPSLITSVTELIKRYVLIAQRGKQFRVGCNKWFGFFYYYYYFLFCCLFDWLIWFGTRQKCGYRFWVILAWTSTCLIFLIKSCCKYSLYNIVECYRQLIRYLYELENSDSASLLCSWKIKQKIWSQVSYHQRKYLNGLFFSIFKTFSFLQLRKCLYSYCLQMI